MFKEIIFPPLEKKHDKKELVWGSDYFFEYEEDRILFMVKCPSCSTKYVYATLELKANLSEIYNGIVNNAAHFRKDWIISCPFCKGIEEDAWYFGGKWFNV